MASYGPKFRVKGASPDGHTYRADIEQSGYTGSVTSFTPAPDGINLRWDIQQRNDLNEPWMVGTGSVRVKEEDPSPLAEIFDGDRFEYRVRLFQDGSEYFVGFARTDLYEDSLWRFLSDPRIEFIDGLGVMENLAFTQAGTQEDVREAIMRALDLLPTDLQAEINMRWFPSGVSSHPIENLLVPNAAWNANDTDTAPNPTPKRKTGRAVLRSLLRRFGLRLMQSGGMWRMRQRLSLMDDSLVVGTYNPDGTRASSGTKTGRERDLTALNADQESRSFQGGFGASSVKYTFKTPLEQVLPNPSFEEPLDRWSTSGDAQRVDINTVSNLTKTSDDAKAVKMTTGDASLKITDAIQLPSDPRIAMILRWSDVRDTVRGKVKAHTSSGHDLSRRTETVDAPALPGKETTLQLAGPVGTTSNSIDGMPIVPAGAELRLFTSDPSVSPRGNSIRLTEPLRVGDESVEGELAQEISSTDNDNLKPELVYWQWVASSHSEFTSIQNKDFFTRHDVRVFMVTPAGDPVSGSLELTWFVGDAANTGFYALDDVGLKFERDGEQIEAFTTTTVDEDGDREVIEVPVGIGPTERSDSRIRTSSDELPEGWGRDSSGSVTLSELHSRESLQMQRSSPETRRFRLRLRSDDPDVLPHHIYLDGTTRYEALALQRSLLEGTARLELAELQDDGTSGLSTTTAFEGESDTVSRGGSGSSVQVLDGGVGGGSPDWTDVTGKPGDLFARSGDSDGYAATTSIQKSDLEGLVENQVASTFPGTPPAGFLLMQVPFHDAFDFNEVLVYAGTAPSADYDITINIAGNTQTVTLPAGSNLKTSSLSDSVTSGDVLSVTLQSSSDNALKDLTVSFDLDAT